MALQYLYHGTTKKLKIGDFLLPHNTYDGKRENRVNAVFATPNLKKAISFGILRAIFTDGDFCMISGNKIIIDKPSSNINTHFYVYLVDSVGFQLDTRDEYINRNNVKIINTIVFDTITAIKEYGFEICTIACVDKNLTIEDRAKKKKEFIKNKNFLKLDIENLILFQRKRNNSNSGNSGHEY